MKNVTQNYPPTFMLHGTNDTDVPFEQSVLMVGHLQKHGVRHELVRIPDAEHGLVGGDPQLVTDGYERAIAFLDDVIAR